jgi:hypothetical protein
MIYFIRYDIKIHDESSHMVDIGSKARCWVKATSLDAADVIVRDALKEYNWKILKLQEGHEVDLSYYTGESNERDNYLEAKTTGLLIMIDTKPQRKLST